MAILYFEAKAKYDQLIKLKEKVEELRKALSSIDLNLTPNVNVNKLQEDLQKVRQEMQSLQISAALAGQTIRTAFEKTKSFRGGIQGTNTEVQNLNDSLGNTSGLVNEIGSGMGQFTKNFTAAALTLKAIQTTIDVVKGGVSKIVDFEAANSTLAAILGLNVEQLRDMTESAEKLGRTTVYTASQVTELQTALSKLGFTRDDILGMQEAILYFAQATGSSLDDAASTTGAALRMFGVKAEDYQKEVGRYTGAMAASVMRSALDFRSISENLATFGPMAHSMNLEIEDTLALFGTLKNMGIEASTAMTSLRNIFTKVAQGKIEGMGKVKSLEDFVAGLKELGGLDPGKGMKMIGPRGGTQFITLIQQADEILKLRNQIREGADFDTTSTMGETMINNVAGSIKMLQSAWEGFVLSFQKSSIPLKNVLDVVTTGLQKATTAITSGQGDLSLESINNLMGGIMGVVSAMVALKVQQKLVIAGEAEELAMLRALTTEKGMEVDADLKRLVSRRMLTQAQAEEIMVARETARAYLAEKTAVLGKAEADIASLTAIKAKNDAQILANNEEIKALQIKTQSLYYSTRHIDVRRIEALQTQNLALAEANKSAVTKLGTLETEKNTLAQEVNNAQKIIGVEGNRSLSLSQLMLNKALTAGRKALDILTMGMLTNPYMLLAAAIGAVVYVIYDWATSMSEAELAQKSLNDEMKRFGEETDKNKQKAEQLRGTIKDQTATLYQQQKAYKELISTYRNFANLSPKQIASISDDEFKSRVNAENDAKERGYLEDRIKALKELQEWVEKSASRSRGDEGSSFLLGRLAGKAGFNVGIDKEIEYIKKKYSVDLASLVKDTPILDDISKGYNAYISVVDKSLEQTYSRLRQFDADVRAAAKHSVQYTAEEAKEIEASYKIVEGVVKQAQEQLAMGGETSFITNKVNDIIGQYKKRIADLNKEINTLGKDMSKKDVVANLRIKLSNYTDMLADMEMYKNRLQAELNKQPLLLSGKLQPIVGLTPFTPNFKSGDFAVNDEETKAEEEARKAETEKELKERKRQAEKIRATEAKVEAERKKQRISDAIASEQAVIDAKKDGTEKQIAQIELNFKKQKQKIEEEYEKIKQTYIQQERDIWLAKNKDATEGDWLKSKKYKSVSTSFQYSDDQKQKRANDLQSAQAKRVNELMKLSASYANEEEKHQAEREKRAEAIESIEAILVKAKKNEIALSEEENKSLRTRLELLKLIQDQSNKNEYANKFVKEFGSYQQKLDLIVKDYEDKIKKAIVNGNDVEAEYYKQKKSSASSELAGEQLKELTTSPLFTQAMSDKLFSKDALGALKDNIENMMATAGESMPLDEYSKYLETYERVFTRLAEINPFGAIKNARAELVEAEKSLRSAKETYDNIKDEENVTQSDLRGQIDIAEKDIENETNQEEKARKIKELEKLQIKLAQSTLKVKNAENSYNNALAKVNNRAGQLSESTKKATETMAVFGDAFKGIGGMIKGDIGEVFSQTGSLIDSAMNAINVFETASNTSAEGIQKVAQTVQEAMAILQIIQIAWQVMQTVVSLFDNSEKRYQEKISNLEGQINALDYAFENLKETMDKTWGLEAISAYEEAMKNLNQQMGLNKELISSKLSKSSSSLLGGYHSLGNKINKSITSSMWASLTSALNKGGFKGTINSIYDLLNLSPEALKYLMGQQEWIRIAGIINSQENKAYKGSELLDDLKKYAEAGDKAEDVVNSLNEKLNGITFDSLKEEFRSLVQTADTSINDMMKSWDEFMRNAVYNQIADGYEKSIKDFYDRLASLNKMKNEGSLTDEEYRAALAKLKAEYMQNIQNARNDYEQGLTDAGVNRNDAEQSATQGGFESMSEDTGTQLNGRFAALQATGAAIFEHNKSSYGKINTSLDVLTGMMGGLSNIADESRTIIANSYLELQGIRENTEVVIKPIKEMASDVKELKNKLI